MSQQIIGRATTSIRNANLDGQVGSSTKGTLVHLSGSDVVTATGTKTLLTTNLDRDGEVNASAVTVTKAGYYRVMLAARITAINSATTAQGDVYDGSATLFGVDGIDGLGIDSMIQQSGIVYLAAGTSIYCRVAGNNGLTAFDINFSVERVA